MQETINLKLKKPEQSDPYDIDQVTNLNADILDTEITALKNIAIDIPNLYVKQKHIGDVSVTNTAKTHMHVIDEKGVSFHGGAVATEVNLIARLNNNEVRLYKPLIVNNRNIENELSNRFTKTESDGKYALKEDSYLKGDSDNRYALKNDAYLKSEVYTKTESDNKYPLKSDTYTKVETDSRYPLKSASYLKSEVYTKTETDDKYPQKTNTYTKSETDTKVNAVSSDVTSGYKAADNDIRSTAQMQKITMDNGGPILDILADKNVNIIGEINKLSNGLFLISMAKGNVGSPNDTWYWYGQVIKVGVEVAIWLTRNTTGGDHSPHVGRIRGGVFQGWTPLNTQSTFQGLTADPSAAIKAQMKKGDVYYQII